MKKQSGPPNSGATSLGIERRWVGTSATSIIHRLPSSLSGKNQFQTVSQSNFSETPISARDIAPDTVPRRPPTLSVSRRTNALLGYSSLSTAQRCSKNQYELLPNKPTLSKHHSYHHGKQEHAYGRQFSSPCHSRDYDKLLENTNSSFKPLYRYKSQPSLKIPASHRINDYVEEPWTKTCTNQTRKDLKSIKSANIDWFKRPDDENIPATAHSNYISSTSLILRSNSLSKLTSEQNSGRRCFSKYLIDSLEVQNKHVESHDLSFVQTANHDEPAVSFMALPGNLEDSTSTDPCASETPVTNQDNALPFGQLEDRLFLHVPNYRRKSGGSLSSQISSNADSAVDLRTPEDDRPDLSVEGPLPTFSAVHRWKCLADTVSQSKEYYTDDWQKRNQSNNSSFSLDGQLSFVSEVNPPCVIVSDHSNPQSRNGSAYNSNITIKNVSLSSDSYKTDRTDESLHGTHKVFFDSLGSADAHAFLSDSSASVDEHTDDYTSDRKQVFKRKQSSWKKIRNIIHWTPFVQHFKKHRYPWVQLAGHKGNFLAGDDGAILKKLNQKEHKSLPSLMKDILRPYVPEYKGDVERDGETYVLMQDLLAGFSSPCVMDVKMGVRTYLEDELEKARQNPKVRKDMYEKMVDIDPEAPTPEERAAGAITKPRYMQWRETISSSASLCFRIEGIKKGDGSSSKDFKTTRTKEQVQEAFKSFIASDKALLGKYLRRLKALRATQETSEFFSKHELVGSSLLFIHDASGKGDIWMIDFGKTTPLPDGVRVNHRANWEEGNHEDCYLVGMDNLITTFEELYN